MSYFVCSWRFCCCCIRSSAAFICFTGVFHTALHCTAFHLLLNIRHLFLELGTIDLRGRGFYLLLHFGHVHLLHCHLLLFGEFHLPGSFLHAALHRAALHLLLNIRHLFLELWAIDLRSRCVDLALHLREIQMLDVGLLLCDFRHLLLEFRAVESLGRLRNLRVHGGHFFLELSLLLLAQRMAAIDVDDIRFIVTVEDKGFIFGLRRMGMNRFLLLR